MGMSAVVQLVAHALDHFRRAPQDKRPARTILEEDAALLDMLV